MSNRSIRHLDFQTLVMVNREVVSLTKERHGYAEEDASKLEALAGQVGATASGEEFEEAMIQKASLLMYRIVTGQHFYEGNKRTALVAGAAFLQMNGYLIDIQDDELASTMDRAGVASVGLDAVEGVVRQLVREGRANWEATVKEIISSNEEFLVYVGSEMRDRR